MAKNVKQLSRPIITPLMTATFALVSFTGILMLLGVRTGALTEFHEFFSVLLVISAVLHLGVNWACFLSYVKKPLTIAFGAAVAVVMLILVTSPSGPHAGGRPPVEVLRRLETASLVSVASVLGLEAEAAAEILRQQGVNVTDMDATIGDLAQHSGRHPPEILGLLMPADAAPARR